MIIFGFIFAERIWGNYGKLSKKMITVHAIILFVSFLPHFNIVESRFWVVEHILRVIATTPLYIPVTIFDQMYDGSWVFRETFIDHPGIWIFLSISFAVLNLLSLTYYVRHCIKLGAKYSVLWPCQTSERRVTLFGK